MNAQDLTDLEILNERYTPVNMTAFRLVNEKTDSKTVIRHIKRDLEILSSSSVKNTCPVRIILKGNVIDIMTQNNGTPIAYFFAHNASFTPQSLKEDLKNITEEFNVPVEEL